MYEGERALTKHCHELGSFDLSGIAPAAKGVPQIEVTFEVDVNGILHVKAIDKAAKNSKSITISIDKGLSEEDRERMIREAEEFAEEDKLVKDRIDAKNKLEDYLYRMKNTITDDQQLATKIDSDDKDRIHSKIEQVSEWLNDNPDADKDDIDDQFHQLEAICDPIIRYIYDNVNHDRFDDEHDEL